MRSPSWQNFFSYVWNSLLFCVCVGFALVFVYLVLASYWPGPYEDYWVEMPLIEDLFRGTGTFDELIIAHNNAHRILIPRLLFYADYKFAAGTNTLLIGVALLTKLGLAGFFNYHIKSCSFSSRLLINALIFMAIFNGALVYNTVFSVNIQWDLMLLFSFLSLANFYRYCSQKGRGSRQLVSAYILYFCASLSHAGGLLCPPIFCLMAFNRKKYAAMVPPILLFSLVFYVTFYALPISDLESGTYEQIIMHQFTMLRVELLHYFRMLSGGIYEKYPILYLYFSLYVLTLFIMNVLLARKSPDTENLLWLYLAAFMASVMFITSASRIGWIWSASAAENRFKVLAIFLLVILTVYSFLRAAQLANKTFGKMLRYVTVAHATALLLLLQYHYSYASFALSNNIFETHAYMLFKGPDRNTGRELGRGVLFRQETDPLAHFDQFFKTHGYAYYDNKFLLSGEKTEVPKTGELLVAQNTLTDFLASCRNQLPPAEIHRTETPVTFSTEINSHRSNILLMALQRNTYFVLDSKGIIIGYSYLFIDPESDAHPARLQGFTHSTDIRFIAEISHNQIECLYHIAPP